MSAYETVIGLEIHVQLNTRSKAFCADDAAFGGAPNTRVSVVSLAHPGSLPRLNRRAVESAVQLGLALGCEINRVNTFDRKNYFYADLPKGYQITQQRNPVCTGGQLLLPNGRLVRIHHIHLEEDAGKSLHDQDPADSLIDLNRAGVPLLEIVSEPDLRSADEVAAYMESVRRLVRWLDVSDGNMEEGSLRCDVNVSVRPQGETRLGQRCEIKNVNSMRFARKAIEFEVNRQVNILENGGRVEQETRGFDAAAGATYTLREKEDAHDYRYFPEPDLPPVVIAPEQLARIREALPALPDALEQQFRNDFGLPAYDAGLLTQERDTAFFFLKLCAGEAGAEKLAKPVANLLINKIKPWADAAGCAVTDFPLSPAHILEFLRLIESGQLSASTATQRLLPALLENPAAAPAQLAASLNLLQNADAEFLAAIVDDVLARFPDKVQEYRKGKKGLIGFFMGEVMRASKGKAEPQSTTKLLQEKLG